MSARPLLRSIGPLEWSAHSYDLAIFALGFESRSTHLLADVLRRSKRVVSYGFNHGHALYYLQNAERFAQADAIVYDNLTDEDFEVKLQACLDNLNAEADNSIFVDISCFSRFRLAAIVHALFSHAALRETALVVDFGYSLAEFSKPSGERRPNTVVGPTHSAFAGWSQGGYASTAAVLGLGYEQDQALGVVEYLQAGEVWAFTPRSIVAEYEPEVKHANALLLAEIPKNRVLKYDVSEPAAIVSTLESVVRGLSEVQSVVLVPFGPKIFVLCSLLVAAMRQDVAVWRVSQGSNIRPSDRRPSAIKVGLRMQFGVEVDLPSDKT